MTKKTFHDLHSGVDLILGIRVRFESKLLNEFWRQLHANISYSERYKKYVIIEPTFALLGKEDRVSALRLLDELVFENQVASKVVEVIDDKTSFFNSEEQALLPYITDDRLNYILLSTSDYIPPISKNPVLRFLEMVKGDRILLQNFLGIAHYHADFEALSQFDIKSFEWLSRELSELGGGTLIALVISERNPTDSLSRIKEGQEAYCAELNAKFARRAVSIVGDVFDGTSKRERAELELV